VRRGISYAGLALTLGLLVLAAPAAGEVGAYGTSGTGSMRDGSRSSNPQADPEQDQDQ
jgi:hypothetical protein